MSSPATDYMPHAIVMPMSYEYPDTTSWYNPYENYMDQSTTVPIAIHQYPYDGTYQYSQHYNLTNEFQEMDYAAPILAQGPRIPRSERVHGNADGYVQTERRKILIRGLTTSTKVDQVQELVRSKAGTDADQVHNISLPLTSSGGNRGYATVTFRSQEVARRVIKRLHGHRFDGRILDVDYTKEGVSRNEESRTKHGSHHSNKQHRDERERRETPKSSSSSTDKKEKPQAKRGVVIANGTSERASESSKKH
jgi:hypothetical protein